MQISVEVYNLFPHSRIYKKFTSSVPRKCPGVYGDCHVYLITIFGSPLLVSNSRRAGHLDSMILEQIFRSNSFLNDLTFGH